MAPIIPDKQRELTNYIYLDKIIMEGSTRFLPAEYFSTQEQRKIKSAVRGLPYPSNKIMEAYYFNGKATGDIIRDLGINKNKFYKYLDKGKFLLRQELNSSFYDKAWEVLYGRKLEHG